MLVPPSSGCIALSLIINRKVIGGRGREKKNRKIKQEKNEKENRERKEESKNPKMQVYIISRS